ncbi:hypothetical protein [Halothece sp. PCC 7418]|uniref:hypothetical protein n=1 Tax=Halothece sp. (strain PCC 7418) TaxID=65093 RepID=UPI001C0A8A0D|nr:hypothetical protein [Halothece sp. PCC 7418]
MLVQRPASPHRFVGMRREGAISFGSLIECLGARSRFEGGWRASRKHPPEHQFLYWNYLEPNHWLALVYCIILNS